MNLPIKHTNTLDDKPSQLTDPKVIDFLTRLYLKLPALYFEVTRTRSDHEATKFLVYHGVDKIGHLDFAYPRQKKGEHTFAVAVGSPYIRKDRAPHHEFISTNYDVALRKAVEVYSLGPDSKLVADREIGEVMHRVQSIYSNAMYKVRSALAHQASDQDFVDIVQYFVDVQILPKANHPLPAYAAKLNTDEVKEKLNNYHVIQLINKEVEAKRGYAVTIERDESIRAFSFDTRELAYHVKSTYELPEWMQSKFAMLKMLEGTQAIAQVGMRIPEERHSKHHSEVKYFIVDGEMQFDH